MKKKLNNKIKKYHLNFKDFTDLGWSRLEIILQRIEALDFEICEIYTLNKLNKSIELKSDKWLGLEILRNVN